MACVEWFLLTVEVILNDVHTSDGCRQAGEHPHEVVDGRVENVQNDSLELMEPDEEVGRGRVGPLALVKHKVVGVEVGGLAFHHCNVETKVAQAQQSLARDRKQSAPAARFVKGGIVNKQYTGCCSRNHLSASVGVRSSDTCPLAHSRGRSAMSSLFIGSLIHSVSQSPPTVQRRIVPYVMSDRFACLVLGPHTGLFRSAGSHRQ